MYFIIQLGYFKAKRQFFDFNLQDITQEVSYIINRYFDEPNIPDILIGKAYREVLKSQQSVILELYQYKDWSSTFIPKISAHLAELLRYHPKPDVATLELFKYFQQQKIIIPSYRVLQDILAL